MKNHIFQTTELYVSFPLLCYKQEKIKRINITSNIVPSVNTVEIFFCVQKSGDKFKLLRQLLETYSVT